MTTNPWAAEQRRARWQLAGRLVPPLALGLGLAVLAWTQAQPPSRWLAVVQLCWAIATTASFFLGGLFGFRLLAHRRHRRWRRFEEGCEFCQADNLRFLQQPEPRPAAILKPGAGERRAATLEARCWRCRRRQVGLDDVSQLTGLCQPCRRRVE